MAVPERVDDQILTRAQTSIMNTIIPRITLQIRDHILSPRRLKHARLSHLSHTIAWGQEYRTRRELSKPNRGRGYDPLVIEEPASTIGRLRYGGINRPRNYPAAITVAWRETARGQSVSGARKAYGFPLRG
ncbi:MAG: hypothetical protein A2W25_12510 [candidate division Zixibacteria bacterium RBG_16_53_22]|nr:MAG: hypothetical protein A2W25_12510 [candidate division Zixibacteria bacterium RBG_16_53_22]